MPKRNSGNLSQPRRRATTLRFLTKTPIAEVLTAYVTHIRATKTAKNAQTDGYYLRDAFGPVCDAVKVTSRIVSEKSKKRPAKPGQDKRRKAHVIDAPRFEQISIAQLVTFISSQVASRGLAPKIAINGVRAENVNQVVEALLKASLAG